MSISLLQVCSKLSSYLLVFVCLQVVKTNQFSVTKHKRVIRQVSGEHGLPGKASLILSSVKSLYPRPQKSKFALNKQLKLLA